jgi:hypothetical protein
MADEPQPPPQPQQQQQFVPEMGRPGSSGYSESHYRFLTSLIESKSAREFFVQITATDFSHQCINAFYKVLTSGFDQNAILAMNDKIDMRIVDFKIVLNLMVLECHESDVSNPAFLTFRENILQTFIDFISRSKNAEERKRLLRSEYGVTQVEDSGRSPQQQYPPQQGGGGGGMSRFGRRGG